VRKGKTMKDYDNTTTELFRGMLEHTLGTPMMENGERMPADVVLNGLQTAYMLENGLFIKYTDDGWFELTGPQAKFHSDIEILALARLFYDFRQYLLCDMSHIYRITESEAIEVILDAVREDR